MDLWQRLRELAGQAAAMLERIRETDPAEVTAEMHQEVDEIYTAAAQVRAEIDQQRSVHRMEGVIAGARADVSEGEIWAALAAGSGRPGTPTEAVHNPPADITGILQAAAGDSGALAQHGPTRDWLGAQVEAAGGGSNIYGDIGLRVPWLIRRPDQVQAATTSNWPSLWDIRAYTTPVFPPDTVLERLGIVADMIRLGEARYRWVRPPTASVLAEGGPVTIEDLAADATDLKPRRISAAVAVSYESAAISGPGQERVILESVQEALRARIQAQILAGDGQAPNLPGLFTTITATPTDDPTAQPDYAGFTSLPALAVDGTYAQSRMDVDLVMNDTTYQLGAGMYQTAGGMSALDAIEGSARSVSVSEYAPAEASDLSLVLARRGRMPGAYGFAMWPMVEITTGADPRAASFGANRILIAHTLVAFALPPAGAGRSDFTVRKLHTAA